MIFRRHFYEHSVEFEVFFKMITIYWVGLLTLGIKLILFTRSVAQLTDIYRGLLTPISINPGLLRDVF